MGMCKVKRQSKDTDGDISGFDYNTSHHRCAWESAGKRCFMPVGFSMGVVGKDKGYCTYHTGYLNADADILKHVDDPDVFDEWVDKHRNAYGPTNGHWACKYTKASLWPAVQGDYDDLKPESTPQSIPDLPAEAVKEYQELQREISNGKHTPESWRQALVELNEHWGVEMVIPPIPGGDRAKAVRVHEDKSADEQIAAAEEAKLF